MIARDRDGLCARCSKMGGGLIPIPTVVTVILKTEERSFHCLFQKSFLLREFSPTKILSLTTTDGVW